MRVCAAPPAPSSLALTTAPFVRPNLLYLENPDSPDLDIGRNSYMMPKIRRSFEHAHQLLTAALGDPRVPSYLAYVIRADDPALQDRPGPELGAQRSNADALR